ncbi:putative F-box/LRR-repeat protein At3g28410 [Panicum virgatum]|uniref:F-box domain-containing protein n=1 Tax=Panicum virgatum TaxID=38727 RepID=A0A8T0UY08_PANVG|nr:putative F-box/LRR-repeat protein At3g28410 [Panicum virgatum]KAG2626076.1 hypothetical protein PVAP13_3KG285881 [Panicum virgatum]
MRPGQGGKGAVPPAGEGGGGIDMLPDGVLGHILGFLLAPEAVRTCVLARRWRHLWKSATRLRIGCCWDDIATPVEEHREFVDNLLLSRGGLPLDTCEFNFGPVQRNDAPRVNSWLRYAITCKARVIILDVQPEDTEPPIPSALLRLDDQLLVSRHLTRLELVFLDLCNSSFIDFSNCSSLEHLVLEYCEITSAKKISSTP